MTQQDDDTQTTPIGNEGEETEGYTLRKLQ